MIEKINTLWELLEIALEDLKHVEMDPRYTIEMGEWYNQVSGTCQVCLAEAVIARRLPLKEGPAYQTFKICERLLALDCLRKGWIKHACSRLRIEPIMMDRVIPKYSADRYEWHEAMKQMLADMKAVGQ